MKPTKSMTAIVSLALLACSASPVHAQRRGKRRPTPAAPSAQSEAPAPAEPAQEAARGADADTTAGEGTTPADQDTAEPGGAAAAAAPAPAEQASPPAAEQSATESEQDSAELQRELSEVMDKLVQARARAAVLGKALWKTTASIEVDNRAAPDQVAVRLALWIDGAPVFSGDGAALSDPERTLWNGFVAPGRHVLTYEVEQRARADEAYRYTQRASLRFEVPRERRTELRLVLDDDSDIADDFKDDQEGEYDVRARLQVRAVSPDDE